MAYVITAACIDEIDGSCIEVCPVDCIYLGQRARYINPDECIECGACEAACPVDAIYEAIDVPDELAAHTVDNASFFTATLRGRNGPLGSPGGAETLGAIAADSPLVSRHPER